MSSPKRGAFIVIEGLDRSGKSTQASLLYERLQGADAGAESPKVVLLKFPDRTTPIGKMIDSYLRSETDLDDRAIHLLFSANRWELASTITSHLQSGTTVLADRYAFSGVAFSAHKGIPYEWCCGAEEGLPGPDLVVFLDVGVGEVVGRGGFGEERYERVEVQRGVRGWFGVIGREVRGRGRVGRGRAGGAGRGVERDMRQQGEGEGEGKGKEGEGEDKDDAAQEEGMLWVDIDAGNGKSKEEVAREIWRVVEPFVIGVRTGPVRRLWDGI